MKRLSVVVMLAVWLASMSVKAETILLDFYADWCQPCKQMATVVDSLAADGYKITKVNVAQDRATAERFGIGTIPTFVVIERGVEVDRIVGKTTVERLRLKMKKRDASPQQSQAWRYERAEKHRAAVVRIHCKESGNSGCKGSGVLVRWKNRLAVITARHVVRDAREIRIEAKGRMYRARVLKVDGLWDCAILDVVDGPIADVEPAEFEYGEGAMQQAGAKLESCGYGPDGRLASNNGLFIGYRRSSAAADNPPDDWMELSGYARQGDSGGPIFNEAGRVVGVLWGTDGKRVVGVQVGRILVLLEQAFSERAYRDCQFRQPTPASPRPVDLESLPLPTAADGKAVLPWRKGVENEERSAAQQLEQINGKLDAIVNRPATPAADPAGQEALRRIDALTAALEKQKATEAEKEPESLRERIKDRLESKGGLVGKLIRQIDEHDPKWILVVVGIIVAIAIWRRGGIHTIIESRRAKLEEDAEGTGLRARAASRILSIHDGAIGDRLDAWEQRFNKVAQAKAAEAATAT